MNAVRASSTNNAKLGGDALTFVVHRVPKKFSNFFPHAMTISQSGIFGPPWPCDFLYFFPLNFFVRTNTSTDDRSELGIRNSRPVSKGVTPGDRGAGFNRETPTNLESTTKRQNTERLQNDIREAQFSGQTAFGYAQRCDCASDSLPQSCGLVCESSEHLPCILRDSMGADS